MRTGECNERVEVFFVLLESGKCASDDESAHGMSKQADLGNGGVFGELIIYFSC